MQAPTKSEAFFALTKMAEAEMIQPCKFMGIISTNMSNCFNNTLFNRYERSNVEAKKP
jgi:hypothetical protein